MLLSDLPIDILNIICKKSKKIIYFDKINGITYSQIYDTNKLFYSLKINKEILFDWTSNNWLFIDNY